jgi:hypothetical protein
MPRVPRQPGRSLDLAGAAVLFGGVLCLIAPVLFGRDLHWTPWLWLVMSLGIVAMTGFLAFERGIERRGELPLIPSALVADRAFLWSLSAAFCFFSANLSFYFVLTLFLQGSLGYSAWDTGLTVLPLALAFVIASRQGTRRSVTRGDGAPIGGCALQIVGLAGLALSALLIRTPALPLLALPLAVFGYGQGLVMAPLSSIVLSTVPRLHAGAASGVYATTAQIANAAGVAAIGMLFFAVADEVSDRAAFVAALAAIGSMVAASAALMAWRRRVQH